MRMNNCPRSRLLRSGAWVSRTKCASSSATELCTFFQFHCVPSEGTTAAMRIECLRVGSELAWGCSGMSEGCVARGWWEQGWRLNVKHASCAGQAMSCGITQGGARAEKPGLLSGRLRKGGNETRRGSGRGGVCFNSWHDSFSVSPRCHLGKMPAPLEFVEKK